MRIGTDKVYPRTSRQWHPSSVGARIVPALPMTQERRLGTIALKLAEAQVLIREAQVVECETEGPWLDAMETTAEEIRAALSGTQAIVIEMGKARRGES